MVQKKLQKNSEYNTLDLDGDGIVSDNELAVAEAIDKHEKSDAQRRMAWIAMFSMIGFTLAVFLPIFPDARIKALSGSFDTLKEFNRYCSCIYFSYYGIFWHYGKN